MTRERLPNRRPCERITINHKGIQCDVTAGYSLEPDPQIMELFIHGGKAGSAFEAEVRDAGISLSLLLQHGVPLDVAQHGFTKDEGGGPASAIGAAVGAIANFKPDPSNGEK